MNTRFVLLFLITQLMAGCQPSSGPRVRGVNGLNRESTYVIIGSVAPGDSGFVKRALDAEHIASIVEGSVMYGIKVEHDDRDRAEKVLKEDSRRKGYSITWSSATY